ncbi:hypothetical protein F4804DRAFT_306514 [Jackrogersella minutella]|nr:hypothetical protein F4804DRAFT_306514 [Jackrogersella minutella]
MRIRNAIPKTLGRPLSRMRTRLPWPNIKSHFDEAPVPTALFNDPTVTVLRTSDLDQQHKNIFVILQKPKPKAQPPPPPLSDDVTQEFGVRMLNYIKILTTPTADSPGTCFLLHFDNKRYLFGNISEGTQRSFVQRNVSIQKVEDIFVTGLVNWHNTGGLFGVILTLADMLASRAETIQANIEERQKKGKSTAWYTAQYAAGSNLRIHGGKNIAHILATARRFIFRKGVPLTPHEAHHDPRSAKQSGSQPDWKDSNINVWYMPIQPNPRSPTSSRKRTLEDFIETSETSEVDHESNSSSNLSKKEDDIKLVDTIVNNMFDSNWTMDTLVETTLHKAKLPGKIFVRDDKGHIQVYTGPLPGVNEYVPDIPVLMRTPWPAAMVKSLPRTEVSTQSMCYIVKTHDRRGRFKPEIALSLGVAKKDFRILTGLKSVVGKDGITVTPEMVLEDSVPGNGFAIIDLPDPSYIEPLVNRPEWSDDKIINNVLIIFWTLGPGVMKEPRLQEFMQKMSTMKHVVSSPDSSPNRLSLESAAAQAFKLRCIDPDRFPLPIYNNLVSLSNTPTAQTTSSIYEHGQIGKTVQFAPSYQHQDENLIPFPNIERLSRHDLTDEVLALARQGRERVTDPKFIAKVEEVESDIPNRDAEVIFLGTGSALPSKYRNVSATLVRVPGTGNFLFDCGENTLGQLRRVFGDDLPEILRDLKCVWISHLHADHHLGTASVLKAWHEETSKSNPSAKLIVSSHVHMIDWLREYSDVEDFGFSRLVMRSFGGQSAPHRGSRILKPWILTEEQTEMYGLKRVDACYVTHCHGALATVFTFQSGLKIAFSGDCRPSNDFVIMGRGATLLIHESTFDDELRGDAVAKKHSTTSEAIEVGRRMGARRIVLTHFSQRYQKVPLDFEIPDPEGNNHEHLDEVVLVAFDYMRVKLGEFRKAQAFLPAVQKLFEDVKDEDE